MSEILWVGEGGVNSGL